jgi:hypothetical protein
MDVGLYRCVSSLGCKVQLLGHGFVGPFIVQNVWKVNIFGAARTLGHGVWGGGVGPMSLGLYAMVRKTTLEDKQ